MDLEEVCRWLERLPPGSDIFKFHVQEPSGLMHVAVQDIRRSGTIPQVLAVQLERVGDEIEFISAKLHAGIEIWSNIDTSQLCREIPLPVHGDVEELLALLTQCDGHVDAALT